MTSLPLNSMCDLDNWRSHDVRHDVLNNCVRKSINHWMHQRVNYTMLPLKHKCDLAIRHRMVRV